MKIIIIKNKTKQVYVAHNNNVIRSRYALLLFSVHTSSFSMRLKGMRNHCILRAEVINGFFLGELYTNRRELGTDFIFKKTSRKLIVICCLNSWFPLWLFLQTLPIIDRIFEKSFFLPSFVWVIVKYYHWRICPYQQIDSRVNV